MGLRGSFAAQTLGPPVKPSRELGLMSQEGCNAADEAPLAHPGSASR